MYLPMWVVFRAGRSILSLPCSKASHGQNIGGEKVSNAVILFYRIFSDRMKKVLIL